MAYTRKQILLDESEFKELKRCYSGGIYARASDSFFLREIINLLLEKEKKRNGR